jgi:putative PIN family toxin of toxin-antitoxin system
LDVISRPHLATLISPTAHEWLKRCQTTAEFIHITERIVACRDATDDKFLELAINGHADFIVSGDADLLVLNPFRDIPIVQPATFIQGVIC